jgi:UDP-N-acetyl-2-amino-2-deoxyglucuronate dehydrogenase
MAYRIGVVGCGGMGKSHAREWAMMENCEVVAAADPSPEAQAWMTEQFPDIRLYDDYTDLISDEPLDIVSIGTWPDGHCPITVMAAEAGLHVLCEKPMALDLRECDLMLEACHRNGSVLVINHNRRHDPRMYKAKAMMEAGEIGRICRGYAACKGYDAGYGMINIGTHLFDGLRMLLGDVVKVFGHLTVDGREATPADIIQGPRGTGLVAGKEATVVLHFSSGVDAVVEWDPGVDRFKIDIEGSEGWLSMRRPDHNLYHYPHADLFFDKLNEWHKVELTPEEDPYEYEKRSSRTWMMLDMLRAIEEGTEHPSDGYAGRAALEIIMAVYWSHMQGRWVNLPLEETQHPLEIWS